MIKLILPDLHILTQHDSNVSAFVAQQFKKGYGEAFDERVKNLRRDMPEDENYCYAIEEAVKREVKSVARQVLTSAHVMHGLQNTLRFSFAILKKIDALVYVIHDGAHRVFHMGVNGPLRGVEEILENDLSYEAKYAIKKEDSTPENQPIHVIRLPVTSLDRVVVLNDSAQEHLPEEVLYRFLESKHMVEDLAQELELQANVMRRDSWLHQENEIGVLLLDIA
ncbi:MAG: hypothetical protein AAB664_01525 [Patescibacteria group bacterium]